MALELEINPTNLEDIILPMVITIVDNNDGTYRSNKTFAELVEAYRLGKQMECVYDTYVL
jgi:hypothetical protein